MNCKLVCLTLFLAYGLQAVAQKSYQLDSPDGKLKTVVNVDKIISFSVKKGLLKNNYPLFSISLYFKSDNFMRFKLTIAFDFSIYGKALPANYQYELSGWVYHTLAKGDAAYSCWLHENKNMK